MKKENKETKRFISKEEQAVIESLKKQVPVIPITVTANIDSTELFTSPDNIADIIKFYCVENATPIILEIYISSTSNMKETSDNFVCRYTYPIIPPCYISPTKKNQTSKPDTFQIDSKFVESTPETTIKKLKTMTDTKIRTSIEGYAKLIHSAITQDLATRYLEAKSAIEREKTPSRTREKESKIKSQLERLSIFNQQKFNFALFELIAKGFIKYNQQKSVYELVQENGTVVPIPHREQSIIADYMTCFNNHKNNKELFNRLLSTIEEYKQYEFQQIYGSESQPN